MSSEAFSALWLAGIATQRRAPHAVATQLLHEISTPARYEVSGWTSSFADARYRQPSRGSALVSIRTTRHKHKSGIASNAQQRRHAVLTECKFSDDESTSSAH